jgi:hypothetical protein
MPLRLPRGAAAKLAPVTRDEWIAAFAAESGVPAPSVEEVRALLDLAGRAAHASERTAAPLACWIAGRAGVPLAELLAAADRVTGGADGAGAPEPGLP